MSRPYSDFISFNKEFVPVFSEDADNEHPNHWKSFIPHQTFIRILEDLAKTLQGGSPENKRPLWIRGAYGSGKSFASFTVKHILEENDEDVRQYFEKHDLSKTLENNLRQIKNSGKVLVVHRSSSSGIHNDKNLFLAIQESIKASLEKNGLKNPLGTLFDDVVRRLSDEEDSLHAVFQKSFAKHKHLFSAYSEYGQVIEYLQNNPAEKCSDVFQSVLDAAENESFYLSLDVNQIKKWIADVIEKNNLKAILFIWDEFSEYFMNNKHSLTGFQELAQMSLSCPFYFFIITHRDSNQIGIAADDAKKLEDRFKCHNIEMTNSTALGLMGNSIEIVADNKETWDFFSERLFNNIRKAYKHIESFLSGTELSIKEADYKKLLPIHPMTAFLLQRISSDLGSDKRTMFSFLSEQSEDENAHNFQNFIKNTSYSGNNPAYLTADVLWDFFFGDNAESRRIDIDDKDIRAVMGYCFSYINQMKNVEERNVFKTIMLFCAIEHKGGSSHGITSLFSPTLSNIKMCFYGTALYANVDDILNSFVKNAVINKLPKNDDTLYVINSVGIDEEKLRIVTDDVRSQYPFHAIIDESTNLLLKEISMPKYIGLRFEAKCAALSNINRIISGSFNGKVPVIYLFVKDDQESANAKEKIENLFNRINQDFVLVDVSALPFSETSYNEYIRQIGLGRYHQKSDPRLSDIALREARQVVSDFRDKVNLTNITIHYKVDKEVRQLSLRGLSRINDKLIEINKKMFPYSLETLTENENVFADEKVNFKTVIEKVLRKEELPNNYGYLKAFKDTLIRQKIWQDDEYYKNIPNHALSKMKCDIEKHIKERFENKQGVCFADLWDILQSKPYGMHECAGAGFVFAFLMKEYSNDYYITDSKRASLQLDIALLADNLAAAIKKEKKAQDVQIVRMSERQKYFCSVSGKIFRLRFTEQNSIEDTIKAIKLKISEWGYPLWAYRYSLDQKDLAGVNEPASLIVEKYNELISSITDKNKDIETAESIADAIKADISIESFLLGSVNENCLKKGLLSYISHKNPQLITCAKQLDNEDKIIIDLRKKLPKDASSTWLIETYDDAIKSLNIDYEILNIINKYTMTVHTMEEAARNVRAKFNLVKLPKELLLSDRRELLNGTDLLYQFANGQSVNSGMLLTTLKESAEKIFQVFIDERKIAYKHIATIIRQDIDSEYFAKIYEKCASSYSADLNSFEQKIRTIHAQEEVNKQHGVLMNLWREISDSETPREWSNRHQISIKHIFSDILSEITPVFETIHQQKRDNKEIEAAINYLKTSDRLQILKDIAKCNEIFKEKLCGEYYDIIAADFDKLKEQIAEDSNIDGGFYYLDRYPERVRKLVERYANQKYQDEYVKKVLEKINCLNERSLKTYLSDLIKKETLVGIKIMKDRG